MQTLAILADPLCRGLCFGAGDTAASARHGDTGHRPPATGRRQIWRGEGHDNGFSTLLAADSDGPAGAGPAPAARPRLAAALSSAAAAAAAPLRAIGRRLGLVPRAGGGAD